jgi:hypothetical protein
MKLIFSIRALLGVLTAVCALWASTPLLAQPLTVVEYRNKVLDAYFLTGRANEQALLDTVADFSRTGMMFQANSAASAAAAFTKICRFYVNVANPLVNSHFYGRQGIDCESIVAANPVGFTYEGYDFALQTPTVAVCPTGTTTVYRSFRALAAGKTSNHRYTVSAATYASAAAAGYVGEGAAFCATAVTDAAGGPSTTAVGTVTGDMVTGSIGAAGGNLTSGDGKLVLTVPAGALAANTTVGIQPITNFSHGQVGSAYRLTPDGQTFAQPVTLTFAYADDELVGASADVLGVAFQTATGFWRWMADPIVNAAAKTVSVKSTHFTDWSRVKGIQMRPPKKTVRVKGSVGLIIASCYPVSVADATGDELQNLGYRCDGDDEIPVLNPISDWSVNGVLGGRSSTTGTVTGSGVSGTFVAPATKPSPNMVTVSARVKRSTLGQTVLVTSNITITEDSWTGTASSDSEPLSASAEVTWVIVRTDNNIATYRPTGTASLTVHGCGSYSPSSGVIEPASGYFLTVDYNTTPPTYSGSGLAIWPAVLTFTCPLSPPPTSTFAIAGFFGGSKGAGGVEAQGQASADGTVIEGTDTNTSGTPVTFKWKFTRN